MTDIFQLRRWAIFAVCCVLAIVLGFSLVNPLDGSSIGFISILFCIGVLPLVMQWHHSLLIVTWNAALNAFFLPGQPDLWIIMAIVSLFFSVWQRSLNRRIQFTFFPSIAFPLLFLLAIMFVTAMARGGIGLNVFGSSIIGGKRYVAIVAAVMGFFALSWQKVPKNRAVLYASLFFLSGVTAVLSDLIFFAGEKFYVLYYLFPAHLARLQATYEFSTSGSAVFRLEGVAWAAVAFFCFLLVRYGIRGLLDLRRPWRLLFLVLAIVAGLFGGFRSRLFLMVALFLVQFFMEGLWRTKYLAILVGGTVLAGALVLPFTEKLPKPFQRAFAFLPVEVDPMVKKDAEDTTRWRLEMWRMLSPEVGEYFWLGKGYAFSASEYFLTQQAEMRGLAKGYETFILVGDYHNGPLSVILPFGIWGMIAFVWFLWAGFRVLLCNYRFGDPELKTINTFLLSFYIVKAVFFFTIFGALNIDLYFFTGLLGLSLSLNGGVKRKFLPEVAVLKKTGPELVET